MTSQINCSSCAASNPEGARFCMGCGAPRARGSPACGAEAPAQARFCISCGAELAPSAGQDPASADGALAEAGPRRDASAPSEERRTVTVLFADLSGYTSVSERL